jgi:hypothetical protein
MALSGVNFGDREGPCKGASITPETVPDLAAVAVTFPLGFGQLHVSLFISFLLIYWEFIKIWETVTRKSWKADTEKL